MDMFKSLAGMVEVELTSADLGSAFVSMTDAEIILYRAVQTDEVTARLSVSRKDYKKLKNLAEKRGDALKLRKRSGIFWSIRSGLQRPVFLMGVIFFLLLGAYLPTRVLFVRVEGNTAIPSRRILEAAENCGICFGASRRQVRSEQMKNALLQVLPELQWAGVNTQGCVAVISVRERSIPQQAEQEYGVSSIVAARDGVILSCTATEGNLLCVQGQAVVAGEVLISGYVDCGLAILATQAKGEIYALTARQIRVISPTDYVQTLQTGEVKRNISFLLGKKRINLWKDSGIWDTTCGRIYEEYYVTLPGEFILPLGLAVEEYVVCSTSAYMAEESDADGRLSAFASDCIRQQMVAGVIRSEDVTLTREDDCIILEGSYLCTEMIGRVRQEQIGDYNGEND